MQTVNLKEKLKEMNLIIKNLEKKIIPNSYDFLTKNFSDSPIEDFPNYIKEQHFLFCFREQVILKQGFSLVADSWIDPLVKYLKDNKLKCVEIMAGLGTITYVLNQKGIDCIAIDNCVREIFVDNKNRWADIIEMDAVQTIKEFEADIYICSWPEMDDSAYNCLMAMRKYRPNSIMLYIGEREGGCTANDNFFKKANFLENNEFKEIYLNYHSWEHIYDGVWFLN